MQAARIRVCEGSRGVHPNADGNRGLPALDSLGQRKSTRQCEVRPNTILRKPSELPYHLSIYEDLVGVVDVVWHLDFQAAL